LYPQVHGASKDTIDYVKKVFKRKLIRLQIIQIYLSKVTKLSQEVIFTDNHWRGIDFMAIALAELGSISERRTYQLISGLRNLPAF
jgi:histidine ammonia-lyase